MQSQTCTVCSSRLIGKYCHDCGQKFDARKPSIKTLLFDLVANLFSFEKSVAATSLKLLTNPASILLNYLNGWKGYYPSPGKMLLVALTIAGLYLAYAGSSLLGLQFSLSSMQTQVTFFIFFLPTLAGSSRLAYFKSQRDFTDFLIAAIYLCSAYSIVIIVFQVVLMSVFSFELDKWQGVLFLLLYFLGVSRTFSGNSWRNILAMFVMQILVFSSLIALVIGLNLLFQA